MATGGGRAGRLLYVVTEDWYFVSHRLGLAVAMREAGFEVAVATRAGADVARIAGQGIAVHEVPFSRRLGNPLADVAAVRALRRAVRAFAPTLVHAVAMKPVLLAPLALPAGMPVVNALTGLGYVFASHDTRARMLRPLVRAGLRHALSRPGAWTLLQNADDAALLDAGGLLPAGRQAIIRGSGVDTAHCRPPASPAPGPPRVLLVARMLRDKGVVEFVEAARRLRAAGCPARFVLVGDTDADNPAAIPRAELARWQAEGAVEWLGRRDDVAALYRGAHVACLPSRREGLPKALLEAAASGLPLVATDVPGCRELVRDGDTGLLVPPGDVPALAAAIGRLVDDPALARRLGAGARRMVDEEFSMARVAGETLALYRRMLADDAAEGE